MEPRTVATTGKTSFEGIYDANDPRAYFRQLGSYDYAVPQHGQRVFKRVLDAISLDTPTVMDICCSYGINAALLKHDLVLADMYDRYRSDDLADLSTEELVEADRAFYEGVRKPGAPVVVGIDIAGRAVDYAVQVGLLDGGAIENLETDDPSAELVESATAVDLVTVTGGIGYITDRTFDRLLDCVDGDRKPWVAALCLRTVPFEPIADCLAGQGLVTEQLHGVTFQQRRFTSEEEQAYALGELSALGVSTAGREDEGSFHVNVFLSRPQKDIDACPIEDLLRGLPDGVLDPA